MHPKTKEHRSGLIARGRILVFILSHPGLHIREISRQMNIPFTTIRYHMLRLEQENIIFGKQKGKYTYYYPVPYCPSKINKTGQKNEPGAFIPFTPRILPSYP